MAYTSWLDKVIAPIWYINASDSKVMVLDASTAAIPAGYAGTIPGSAYRFVQASSIVGPEGVGLQPPFDRDGDGVSDLVEATTFEHEPVYADTAYYRPAKWEEDMTGIVGIDTAGALIGGVKLPQEGIGFYHFHGSDDPEVDNWGTLKLVKVLEQAGREWNLRHPEGPRIGVGDMSFQNGGEMCWGEGQCHEQHQRGLNADLRYFRSDGAETGYNFKDEDEPFPGYSRQLTQELVEILCDAGVTKILVDEEERDGLKSPAGCIFEPRAGHFHHIHIIAKP